MCLVGEYWCLEEVELRDSHFRFCFCGGKLTDLQRNAAQQEVCESRFARKHILVEKDRGRSAELPRLEIPPFVEQKKSLIQIEEPRPDKILLLLKHFASPRKPLEGLHRLSLLPAGDSFVCQTFGCLIGHAELLEALKGFAGHFPGFLTQGQLEINLRKVHVTECHVIRIAVDFASPAGGQEHLNSPAVLASEVVQVSNVVISLVAQEGHAVSLAQISRLLITIQRSGEIIQADEAHRHVVEANGDSFPLPMFGKCLVGPFVVRESFLEAVLAMKYVAHVVFQARHSQGLP